MFAIEVAMLVGCWLAAKYEPKVYVAVTRVPIRMESTMWDASERKEKSVEVARVKTRNHPTSRFGGRVISILF